MFRIKTIGIHKVMNRVWSSTLINHSTQKCSPNRVAIIGSGPSGFYSAKYLLEHNSEIQVDMYEKLPTPFGLVRFGVAPDHPEVKSVGAQFCDVADTKRFRYFGNVKVGDDVNNADVSVFNLLSSYNGVILAHGASSDNELNITDESLNGVYSARHFVNWYNGHPEVPRSDDVTFDLSKVEHVVVVGQGNVALDCARILTRNPSELAETDISHSALEVLKRSAVKTVSIVGRRGHVQSAFTIKEFRELTKLEGVRVNVREEDIRAGITDATKSELENNRPKKRIVELIQSVAFQTGEDASSSSRVVDFRFLCSPTGFIGTTNGEERRVSGLRVRRNRLEGEPHQQKPVFTTEAEEILPCELVLKSVGYKCEPLSDALPFNSFSNTMPHLHGRVLHTASTSSSSSSRPYDVTTLHSEKGESVSVVKGLYVTGWLKRGPSGIIGSNISDAKETVASVLSDLKAREEEAGDVSTADPSLALVGGLKNVVNWAGFLRIDAEERRRGALCDPPRERDKLLDRQEMLRVVGEQ